MRIDTPPVLEPLVHTPKISSLEMWRGGGGGTLTEGARISYFIEGLHRSAGRDERGGRRRGEALDLVVKVSSHVTTSLIMQFEPFNPRPARAQKPQGRAHSLLQKMKIKKKLISYFFYESAYLAILIIY